jgi:hypothetical protein
MKLAKPLIQRLVYPFSYFLLKIIGGITTMPLNSENNNKTEAVQLSLAFLLAKLKKTEIHIRSNVPSIFDQMEGFHVVDEMSGLQEGIRRLEAIQFKAVDDLDSVKKLRLTELWFAKNNVLNNVRFSSYQSQIKPIFLAYADIDIQLDALVKKTQCLYYRGHHVAAYKAKDLILDLRDLNRWYFEEKILDYDAYQSRALAILQKARPDLAQHRGCKKIVGNLCLLIGTLGMAFMVNKCLSGHYLFFQKTDSAEQLDQLKQTLASVRRSLPSPVHLKVIKGGS